MLTQRDSLDALERKLEAERRLVESRDLTSLAKLVRTLTHKKVIKSNGKLYLEKNVNRRKSGVAIVISAKSEEQMKLIYILAEKLVHSLRMLITVQTVDTLKDLQNLLISHQALISVQD